MDFQGLFGSTLSTALLWLAMLHANGASANQIAVAAPAAAPTPAATQAAPAATITKTQAEAAALAANPGQTVAHTSLQKQSGTAVYDVDFANGGGALVNAQTGAVIKSEAAGTDQGGHGRRGGPGGANQAALAAKATVTKAQAEAAALAASPGNTVNHSRLGDDNGTVFWDVDFSNGGGVRVNALTGAVIAIEAAGTDHGGH